MGIIKSLVGTAAGTRANASTGGEVVKFPVIGIKRTVVKHTKTKDTTTEYALQMRPWELAPLAIGGLLAWWIVQGGLGNGTRGTSLGDKTNPLPWWLQWTPTSWIGTQIVNATAPAAGAGADYAGGVFDTLAGMVRK